MDNVHPIYKIIAVLCVGSVAKALFGPAPQYNAVVSNAAKAATDVVADKLTDVAVKGK